MSELDALTEQVDRLLENIRTKYSLEEWRYAFREIIFSGAMKILDEFPEIIIGPRPESPTQPQQQQQQGPTHGGGSVIGKGPHPLPDGQRPPYYPSGIGQLVCIVLGNCPQPS